MKAVKNSNSKDSNQMHNQPSLLSEGLNYKDLDRMMKATIHVDEFASKMGDDDDIIVLSFFVRDPGAAKDLVNWFEKGYDFVLDADQSPGEIKPGRYLVYVELSRRSRVPDQIAELIDDLSTLTEFEPKDWTVHHDGEEFAFSVEEFRKKVPLSPKQYRDRREADLNTVREAAGLPVVATYDKTDPDLRKIQNIAGI
jgi:hypothetical protein